MPIVQPIEKGVREPRSPACLALKRTTSHQHGRERWWKRCLPSVERQLASQLREPKGAKPNMRHFLEADELLNPRPFFVAGRSKTSREGARVLEVRALETQTHGGEE